METTSKSVAQIVAQFRAEPARIMPNRPDQYRCKRLKTLDPTSSDTFSRPPVFCRASLKHVEVVMPRFSARKLESPRTIFVHRMSESTVFVGLSGTASQ
jgi:hypothetical protein